MFDLLSLTLPNNKAPSPDLRNHTPKKKSSFLHHTYYSYYQTQSRRTILTVFFFFFCFKLFYFLIKLKMPLNDGGVRKPFCVKTFKGREKAA